MPLLRTEDAVIIILQRSIQQGQLPQLILLELVLLIIDHHQHLFDEGARLVHILLRIAGDEHVQGLVFAIVYPSIAATTCTLLHTSLASDGNLAIGLDLQFLLGLAPRSNDQTNEVVRGVFLHGDGDLLDALPSGKALRPHGGIQVHHLLQYILSFVAILLPPSYCTGIGTFSKGIVDGRWRWRSGSVWVISWEGIDARGLCV
mmetsp:Transcript_5005/g.7540  ORF Transcript_5005/g.7540 Transcript_5005/m.7540 type:complete len:203 (-) Transcript_5005:602-1210(-)